MIAILFILVIAFGFSFTFWLKLFNELDYFKINYTKETKKRMLWVIFGNLLSLILLFYLVRLVFLHLVT